MNEWRKVKLGNYLYIKGRIGWKGLKKSEYLSKSNYRIINAEAISDGKVNWSKTGYITKERYEESPEIMLQNDDILISKDGTIGKIGYIKKLEQKTTVASGIFVIRNNNFEILDTKFIYHFLSSKYFKNFIQTRTEGSVIPHLYQKDFIELEMPFPSLDIQKKISKILSDIDEKIELNSKINDNLVIPHLYQKDFIELEMPFPSLDIQKKISKILSDIDEKIELNSKINDNLIIFLLIIILPFLHQFLHSLI